MKMTEVWNLHYFEALLIFLSRTFKTCEQIIPHLNTGTEYSLYQIERGRMWSYVTNPRKFLGMTVTTGYSDDYDRTKVETNRKPVLSFPAGWFNIRKVLQTCFWYRDDIEIAVIVHWCLQYKRTWQTWFVPPYDSKKGDAGEEKADKIPIIVYVPGIWVQS